MHLLVAPAADTHPPLEVASWIVAIVAFGLAILQLIFYWFGRKVPLQVRATGHETRITEGQQVLMLNVEFRSRTRDTQTVRELVLFEPPNALSRALRPWWYEGEISVTPPELPEPLPLPLTIDGHDTAEVRLAFDRAKLVMSSRTRLKVRASRRRPHIARIHMKAEPERQGGDGSADVGQEEPNAANEAAPQLAVGQAAEASVVPAPGTPSSQVGERKTEESDSTRTRANRIAHTVRRYAPAGAAFMVLLALAVLARACS
jgi:hypothetical protein